MTDELTKTFFDTFGIEPKSLFICKRGYYPEVCTQPTCKGCNEAIEHGKYPQITDHILLELLVIMTRQTDIIEGFDSVQELKEFVLKDLIYSLSQSEADIVKHQVRTLFKEG